AFLALRGNRVERPEQLAAVYVEAAYVALQVRLRRRPHADVVRGTDDHHVADHERGRAVADARLVRDLAAHADHEIHDAVLPEARRLASGARIERDEIKARSHDEQSLVAGVIGPIR